MHIPLTQLPLALTGQNYSADWGICLIAGGPPHGHLYCTSTSQFQGIPAQIYLTPCLFQEINSENHIPDIRFNNIPAILFAAQQENKFLNYTSIR